MMKTIRLMMGLLAVLLPISFAHANESGAMIKADVLKAEPFRDAKTTGSLSVGDQVVILKKNGGWLNVKSAKGSGCGRLGGLGIGPCGHRQGDRRHRDTRPGRGRAQDRKIR
jgi:hypothetical protein